MNISTQKQQSRPVGIHELVPEINYIMVDTVLQYPKRQDTKRVVYLSYQTVFYEDEYNAGKEIRNIEYIFRYLDEPTILVNIPEEELLDESVKIFIE